MKKKMNAIVYWVLLAGLILGCNKSDSPVTPAAWNYESPDKWGSIGYGDCTGKVQSPVNIDTTTTIKTELPTLGLHYRNSSWGIIDNGHNIQINVKQTNSLVLEGTAFKVMQFHFHRMSEHKLEGNSYDMEMHIVHQDTISSDLLVVALWIKQGVENPFIKKIWGKLPSVKNSEVLSGDSIRISDVFPASQKYFTYTGSLTTPPCTQGLDWIIFKQPIEVSPDQISQFAQFYPDNERPVQALNFREVLESK